MKNPESPARLSRRRLLQRGLAASLAFPASRVLGANEDIRVAVVGVRSRGNSHLEAFSSLPGSRVVAVCDVDPAVLAKRTAEMSDKQGFKVDAVEDFRTLLDRKDIDVISVATPNHWHALMGIWCCQAGKDAYIEKPISHNVREGRLLVEAARKYGRVIQGGTQNRSKPNFQEAVAYGRSGALGRLKVVRGTCYKARMSIGTAGKGGIPEGLDYDLWTGPAEMKPLGRENLHYDWHWVYHTGNGDMGNQGIHQMDVATWVLGDPGLSKRVLSVGGRLGYVDDGETPNSQVVYHEFDEAPLVFETRGLPKSKEYYEPNLWKKNMGQAEVLPDSMSGIALVAEYEDAYIYMDHGSGAAVIDKDGKVVRQFEGAGSGNAHYENFLDAVRSRDVASLNGECEKTHYSSALCHTGMISHQLGQTRRPEEIGEAIAGDSVAAESYDRLREHLGANGIDLNATPLTLGPALGFDRASERFAGNREWDEAANAQLFRRGRGEFILPESV